MTVKIRKITYGLPVGLLLFLTSFVQAQTTSPHLSLTPATKSEVLGDSFEVSVNVDTGGKAIGSVDAIIEYDQTSLEVVSVSEGLFFPTVTSTTATLGKIKIYGIAATGVPKTGTGILATITFKGKSEGTALVSFTCQSGSTVDSNINEGSVDVIVCSENDSGSYIISSSSSSATQSGSSETTASALPQTGGLEPTILLLGIGVILSIFGLVFW